MQRPDGIFNLFDFKASFQSETIRVEWPVESAIALFPSDISILMIRLNHARNLTAEEVEQYNASVDYLEGKEPVVEPPKEPEAPADEKTDEPEEPVDEQTNEPEQTTEPETPADEKPADVQAEESEEEKKKPGRPKKHVAIPGLTN